MKTKVFLFLFGVAIVLFAISTDAQDAIAFHISDFMTSQEVKDSGVGNLSAHQRVALDKWFERYTTFVIHKLSDTGSGLDYPTSKGHWIDEVCADGAIVILEDDSVWAIESANQVDTSLWLQTTNVDVSHLTHPAGDYRFLLTNTDDHEKAHAKYMGKKD